MQKVLDFFVELWYRLGLPSPTFFKVLQWISASVAFVSGLPTLLLTYEAQSHITLPAWMFTFSSSAAFYAGVIGFIISKIPVKNDTAIVKTKLPFSKKGQ